MTLYYIVGYPNGAITQNVHAPDSMTATFSIAGTGGPFSIPVVESAGWNDNPAPVPNVGGAGEARILTVSLGGQPANAVQLDFRSNAEWVLLSEVGFDGRAVPEPTTQWLGACALAAMGAGRLRCRRKITPSAL